MTAVCLTHNTHLLPTNVPKVELQASVFECLDVEAQRRRYCVNVLTVELLESVCMAIRKQAFGERK